jgi:hypothetical protein
MAVVQRALAATLLVLFSFSLIGPGVFTASESQLPECCRRLGQHHCVLMGASTQDESSGPAVKNGGDRCPFFPVGWSVSAHQYPLFWGATRVILTSLVSHPVGQTQIQARYRISFSRSSQKRGPPSFFL